MLLNILLSYLFTKYFRVSSYKIFHDFYCLSVTLLALLKPMSNIYTCQHLESSHQSSLILSIPFQKHVIPKFSSATTPPFPVNCRENSDDCSTNDYQTSIDDLLNDKTGDIFYKYIYLWDKSRMGRKNEFCHSSTVFEPSKSSIPSKLNIQINN